MAFQQVIEYLAEADPIQMLEMMRCGADMTLCIRPSQMLELMANVSKRLSPQDPWMRWIYHHRGTATLLSQSIPESRILLARAAEMALAAGDDQLLREATYGWGISEILLGRSSVALNLADRLENMRRTPGSLASYQINSLRAAAYLHQGRYREALATLEDQNPAPNTSNATVATFESHRALYLATLGKIDAASKAIEGPVHCARETGHVLLQTLCDLTLGYIEIHQDADAAANRFSKVIGICREHEMVHLGMYAQEGLAAALKRQERLPECKGALVRAKRTRNNLGFRYTRWDQVRLQSLVEA